MFLLSFVIHFIENSLIMCKYTIFSLVFLQLFYSFLSQLAINNLYLNVKVFKNLWLDYMGLESHIFRCYKGTVLCSNCSGDIFSNIKYIFS